MLRSPLTSCGRAPHLSISASPYPRVSAGRGLFFPPTPRQLLGKELQSVPTSLEMNRIQGLPQKVCLDHLIPSQIFIFPPCCSHHKSELISRGQGAFISGFGCHESLERNRACSCSQFHVSLEKAGMSGYWDAGILRCWDAGMKGCWDDGILGCWGSGMLGYWVAGMMGCWDAGMKECGDVEMQGCRSAGLHGCCVQGCWYIEM